MRFLWIIRQKSSLVGVIVFWKVFPTLLYHIIRIVSPLACLCEHNLSGVEHGIHPQHIPQSHFLEKVFSDSFTPYLLPYMFLVLIYAVIWLG